MARFRFHPTRWHLGIALALTVLVLSGLYHVMLTRAQARQREIWEARLHATVRDRQLAIERWSRDLLSDAATVAAYPTAVYVLEDAPSGPLPFPAEEGAAQHLRGLLAAAAQSHGYRAAWVVKRDGEVVTGSRRETLPPSGRALADSAAAAGASAMWLTLVDDRPAVLLAAPVKRPGTDVVLGAVVLEEDPYVFLYPLLRDEPVPTRSGEVLLSQKVATQVYLLSPPRKDGRRLLQPVAGTEGPAAVAALGATEFLPEMRDYAGDLVWAATAPIRGTTWGLQAKIDRAEALADAAQSALLELLALSGVLLAAFGVGFGLWRQQKALHVAAVAQERARFAALLMHANEPILIMDENGVIREVNDRALEFYGHPYTWFIGRSAAALRSPEEQDGFSGMVAEVHGRGQVVTETEHVAAAGRRAPVEISARVVDLQGQTMLLTIVRDLTDRLAADAALRQSEEKYRAIVENSPDVISRVDASLRVLYMSPAITQYVATGPEQVVGRTVEELGFPAELTAAWVEGYRRVFESAQPHELEFELLGRQWYWRSFPEFDAEGRVVAVVNLSQDVTERRRLEEQVRQAQKMDAVGRLAGGVAHDFNNILTAIHGHATMARADLAEGEGLAAELDEIIGAADRAASLTRQLLAFSRRQLLQPRRVDMVEAVRGLDAMLRRLIGEHIEVQYELGSRPLPVLADPGQLEQVLLNLCINARDAMPQGGVLRIALAEERDARSGPHVVLQVTDSGVGMPPQLLERIFEPFFTTKEQSRGTGLGLSTVYGIVQQCGGRTHVESEPGQGTTFTVYLPYHAAASTDCGAAPPLPLADQSGRTALVAEDDPIVRRLTERLLTGQGYRVIAAPNGAEALLLAETEPVIDLLLTDVVMPELGGIELARRLRAARPDVAVVFMTGYTQDFSAEAAPIDPQLHLVQKPFKGADLLRQLERALAGAKVA